MSDERRCAVSIVVPAYNEERGIGPVLEELKRLDPAWEILVVDDGSSDGTAAEVERHGVRVIRHKTNRGYGASLKTGIRAARSPWIVITDADGTYPNERIPELVRGLVENDMVVGARVGKNVAIPLIRRPAKWALNALANYLSETKIPDLNSGLRAFRKDEVVRFFDILPSGFSFTTTITLAFHVNDRFVDYIPVDYHKREGKSKIKPIQDTLNFTALILRTILYFRPLKIFLPLAGFLALAGVGILIYSWKFTPRVMDASVSILLVSAVQMAAIGLLADLIDKRSGRA
ncbi:MAG: glycosyltransferase family 2 protein [Candidatus Eisenbacteria bacterium]|nr:glycosyltransferase family 2 protein [Candidatus Eisenbacteria bacterium]MCC7140925.1 glycosyltransferase family 2 protein [Candidatus Eisenbacteria bacterium]